LITDLEEQEAILKKCIEQLESVDMARINLINQLKVALNEQVSSSFFLLSSKCFTLMVYYFAYGGNTLHPIMGASTMPTLECILLSVYILSPMLQ
jgi:hypothetical protein